MPLGQIGFVSHDGSTGGPGSLAGPCLLLSARELALLFRGLLRVKFAITLSLQSTYPSCHSEGIGFVSRLSPGAAGLVALAASVFFGRRGANWVCLARSARATAPPAFTGPRPSLSASANWLCLYNRFQRRLRRRPRPSAPASVAAGDWLCLTRFGPAASAWATLPALGHGCPPAGNWLCFARQVLGSPADPRNWVCFARRLHHRDTKGTETRNNEGHAPHEQIGEDGQAKFVPLLVQILSSRKDRQGWNRSASRVFCSLSSLLRVLGVPFGFAQGRLWRERVLVAAEGCAESFV